jgi:hypothetical protein
LERPQIKRGPRRSRLGYEAATARPHKVGGRPLNYALDPMAKRHLLPKFLAGLVSPEAYERWLVRKAAAHVKRDRKRGHSCTGSAYRDAIHLAVEESNGLDAYTGESLDWTLISTYKNEDSKAGRHAYKASFALLPTVDHVDSAVTTASFKICSWRTNDAKHDLSIESFVELCRAVLTHRGFKVGDVV